MRNHAAATVICLLAALAVAGLLQEKRGTAMESATARKTEISIRGDAFTINGRPTYAGRTWQGHRTTSLTAGEPPSTGEK